MDKVKNKYIFPNFLAQAMSKVSMQVQLEASMMSSALIFIGMILTIIYFSFFINFALWYKITIVVNMIAGMIFMSSNLITTFQQYRSYLEAQEFQKQINNINVKTSSTDMKGGKKDA